MFGAFERIVSMEKGEDLKINILINGVRLPLTVKRNEEELYRNAEKIVVKFINDYQQLYSQKSYSEILTYVAFRLAVILNKQSSNQDLAPLAERIKELDNELNTLLAK
ncbi:MAG: cell division protein ZapA [Paludibacter sp.]